MLRMLISACTIYFRFDLVNRSLRRHVEVSEAIAPGAVARIFRQGNFAPALSLRHRRSAMAWSSAAQTFPISSVFRPRARAGANTRPPRSVPSPAISYTQILRPPVSPAYNFC